MFLISCGVSKFPDNKEFCSVRVCISIIAFEGVLSISLNLCSKCSGISLLEILGWVLDISLTVLADCIETSFSFSL